MLLLAKTTLLPVFILLIYWASEASPTHSCLTEIVVYIDICLEKIHGPGAMYVVIAELVVPTIVQVNACTFQHQKHYKCVTPGIELQH